MTKTAGWHMDHDWYEGLVPPNVEMGADAFLESAYALDMFRSQRQPGLILGEASGAYDQSAFIVGPQGRVTVGAFTCLNSTTVLCHDRVEIGRHCLTAWGAVIMDTWFDPQNATDARRRAMDAAADDRDRFLPPVCEPRPVRLEDNVWIGFDAVIMPGVTLGRGCVIGCKTVIREDVEPYAVVVGSPPRVVRKLKPNDTEAVRKAAMRRFAPSQAP